MAARMTVETRPVNLATCTKGPPRCLEIRPCDCREAVCACEPPLGTQACVNVWGVETVVDNPDPFVQHLRYHYLRRASVLLHTLTPGVPCPRRRMWPFENSVIVSPATPISIQCWIEQAPTSDCVLKGTMILDDSLVPGFSSCFLNLVPGGTAFGALSLGFAASRLTGRAEGPTCSPFGWYGFFGLTNPANPAGCSGVPYLFFLVQLTAPGGPCSGPTPGDFDGPPT